MTAKEAYTLTTKTLARSRVEAILEMIYPVLHAVASKGLYQYDVDPRSWAYKWWEDDDTYMIVHQLKANGYAADLDLKKGLIKVSWEDAK